MSVPRAEIYLHPKTGRFHARVRETANTGHSISEDSGRFTVTSIITKNGLLCRNATREEAEKDIAREWIVLTSFHVAGTSREFEFDYEIMSLEQRVANNNLRNHLADRALRPLLRVGDRIRATKAECGAREATFTFSHWKGGWIVSTGTTSIAPGSVYSINGKVFRV